MHTSLNQVMRLIVSNTPKQMHMWTNETESTVILSANKWSNFIWCNGHSNKNKTVQKFNRQTIIAEKNSPSKILLCPALNLDCQRFYIGGVECFHFSACRRGHVQA